MEVLMFIGMYEGIEGVRIEPGDPMPTHDKHGRRLAYGKYVAAQEDKKMTVVVNVVAKFDDQSGHAYLFEMVCDKARHRHAVAVLGGGNLRRSVNDKLELCSESESFGAERLVVRQDIARKLAELYPDVFEPTPRPPRN